MTPHQTEMRARRIRQLARVPGFTPVLNQRHEAKKKAIMIAIQSARPEDDKLSGPELYAAATREFARTLPATPIGVRTRPWVSRSKY